jgi:hypothetical protein
VRQSGLAGVNVNGNSRTRHVFCSSSTAAQEERERVALLAGQRRGGIDQPGDVGIQAGLPVIFEVLVVVAALVVLVVNGRGRRGA